MLDEPRPPRRVLVPLPMPEGVSYEGVFGEAEGDAYSVAEQVMVARGPMFGPAARKARREAPAARVRRSTPGGVVGGVLGGVEGGVAGVGPRVLAPPPPPAGPPAYDTTVAHGRNARVAGIAGAQGVDPLGRSAAYHAEAGQALERGRALAAARDWRAALRRAQVAWALADAHRRAQPWADGGGSARAAELWRESEEALRHAAMAAAPALRKRLSLVIRNADLAPALHEVARAAGIAVALAPGALEDAALVTHAPLRVAWLDLRRATGAQALTWLLQPFGLAWTAENGAVVVRSPRRAATPSVWTYDVRDLAAAAPEDFERSAARVVGSGAPVIRLLGASGLLVMGDARAHAQTADFLATLRKGAAGAPDGERVRARAVARAAASLSESSWTLLAAACLGSVDDEAASLLLEGMADRDALATLAQRAPALVLRTAWAVAQARAVAPADAALRRLAETVAPVATTAGAAASDPVTLAYVALLEELPASLRPAGLDHGPAGRSPARTRLETLARGPVQGDDAAVLAGLGQRLAGREAWNAGRDERARMAGTAGVSAGALRVLSRLERARLTGL
jgi:hypothetical protein